MHAETIRWRAAALAVALLVVALIAAFAMTRGAHPQLDAMSYGGRR